MGSTNLRRNLWLAGASTLIMIVTLVILAVLALLFVITNYSVNTIRERVDISAYFKNDLSENQILVVRDQLNQDPRIKTLTYVSPEEALVKFKEKNADKQDILDSVAELSDNPLQATLQIKANTLEDYHGIAELLKSEKYAGYIDEVNFEDNRIIIERLNSLLGFILTFGIILMVLFSIIAILVIFNTITLTIYNRREEVEIMRLVGATNWYIRGPFIIEAIIYSLIATIITSLLLLPVFSKVLPTISSYLIPGETFFAGNWKIFAVVVFFMFVISILLSIISSMLAIRRYLKI